MHGINQQHALAFVEAIAHGADLIVAVAGDAGRCGKAAHPAGAQPQQAANHGLSHWASEGEGVEVGDEGEEHPGAKTKGQQPGGHLPLARLTLQRWVELHHRLRLDSACAHRAQLQPGLPLQEGCQLRAAACVLQQHSHTQSHQFWPFSSGHYTGPPHACGR